MTSATVSAEQSMYHQQNGVMHHLSSLIASASGQCIPIIKVSELFDSETLSTERRHELAEQVTRKFALPQNHQPYTVIYVEQIEAFIAIDIKELRRS